LSSCGPAFPLQRHVPRHPSVWLFALHLSSGRPSIKPPAPPAFSFPSLPRPHVLGCPTAISDTAPSGYLNLDFPEGVMRRVGGVCCLGCCVCGGVFVLFFGPFSWFWPTCRLLPFYAPSLSPFCQELPPGPNTPPWWAPSWPSIPSFHGNSRARRLMEYHWPQRLVLRAIISPPP